MQVAESPFGGAQLFGGEAIRGAEATNGIAAARWVVFSVLLTAKSSDESHTLAGLNLAPFSVAVGSNREFIKSSLGIGILLLENAQRYDCNGAYLSPLRTNLMAN